MNDLMHFEAKALTMTASQLTFALHDIKETLALWSQETDYTRKLWAEWDAYIVELEKRG